MASLSRSVMVFLGFAISLVGCATVSPTYQLAPSSGDVVWAAGRPVMQQQIDGVEVAVSSTGQAGGSLGLHVQIANAGAERLDVSPADVTFTACSGTTNASCAPTKWVLDPEQELAKVDRRARDEQASATAAEGFLAVLLVLNVVADVGSVASGHPHAIGVGAAATADLMGANEASSEHTMGKLEAERDFWANAALRRSTVYPGQAAAGVVMVPIHPRARYLWLHVRVGQRRFSFRFDQTEVAPG